ncbi:MAG TPA: response regulator [Thermoanaerobaculia bacterium]
MPPPILLVDDDLSLAHTMAAAIESLGVPVEHCATGEVAIELIRQKKYAVIIVDIVLPDGISGIYVVNAVRQIEPELRPTILMMTGGNLENLRGVDRALVTAVMLKPVDFQLFADYVLATYRRALNLKSDTGVTAPVPEPVRVHTHCGDCGSEITPWILDRPLPPEVPDETFVAWLDTSCATCGATPRTHAGYSEWMGSGL